MKNKNLPTYLAIIFCVAIFLIMFGSFMRTKTEVFYLKDVEIERNMNIDVKYYLLSHEDKLYRVTKQDYNLFKKHLGIKLYAVKNGFESKWDVMIEEEYYTTYLKSSVLVWNEFPPTKKDSDD